MKLSDLLSYDSIVIQGHDNPDADAIAAGFGIYSYLRSKGKEPRFIYSGDFKITKSNLRYLISTLDIPIEYVEGLDTVPDLLITEDCMYGEGNVRKFEAKTVAVIDHHRLSGALPELSDVRQGMGSCSTIVWDLLRAEGFVPDEALSTALYYGLYTDTGELAEVSHPLDRDMLDALEFDASLIRRLRHMNISLGEAKIAGIAMLGVEYHEAHRYALLESEPCDPNILGLISDFYLAVDSVDVCVVFSVLKDGIKFSVRSCVPEVCANELAAEISKGIGTGGGHVDKAGGFLSAKLISSFSERYAQADSSSKKYVVTTLIRERLHHSLCDTEIIRSGSYTADPTKMKKYVKLPVKQGCAFPAEFLPCGTPILVRSLEGDTNIEVAEDTVIMIGVRGEVYASRQSVFDKNYCLLDEPYDMNLEYFPTIKNSVTGETIPLAPYAKTCRSNGGNIILSAPLERPTKVFTKWNKDEYFKGEPGDFLSCKEADPADVYIIAKDIFAETYKEIQEVT
ncbi:MAG: DHH family phosphoesterase [Lachnospiraceae bacterium]|nr:DHH family phosphoesterase [Lachnospiraceae bacterium]